MIPLDVALRAGSIAGSFGCLSDAPIRRAPDGQHVVGMKVRYGRGDSESILASSVAGETARFRLKHRHRYWWTGLLSFEKPTAQDADSILRGGRYLEDLVISSGFVGPA